MLIQTLLIFAFISASDGTVLKLLMPTKKRISHGLQRKPPFLNTIIEEFTGEYSGKALLLIFLSPFDLVGN